jgi:hypothetical protein
MTQEKPSLLRRLEPPGESSISTVMNGIGNGAMIGMLPTLLMNLFDEMKGTVLSDAQHKSRGRLGIGMTVVGCALGAAYGIHEARRLNEYRKGISQEVNNLRDEVQSQRQEINTWEARLKAKDAKKAEATPMSV